jgi:hypothetical protein
MRLDDLQPASSRPLWVIGEGTQHLSGLTHRVDLAAADIQAVTGRDVVIWSADPMARVDLAERLLAPGSKPASVRVVQTPQGWSIAQSVQADPQLWTFDALDDLANSNGVLIVAKPKRVKTRTAWNRKCDEWRKVVANFLVERPNASKPSKWQRRVKPLEQVTVQGLLERAFGIPPDRSTRSDQMLVSKILKTSGWKKIRPEKDGRRFWAYRRPRGTLRWG